MPRQVSVTGTSDSGAPLAALLDGVEWAPERDIPRTDSSREARAPDRRTRTYEPDARRACRSDAHPMHTPRSDRTPGWSRPRAL